MKPLFHVVAHVNIFVFGFTHKPNVFRATYIVIYCGDIIMKSNSIILPLCTSLVIALFTNTAVAQIETGTSIVIYATSDTIFIGADNQVGVTAKDNEFLGTAPFCKILRVKNTYFTFAGTNRITNTGGMAFDCARLAIEKGKNIECAANLFREWFVDSTIIDWPLFSKEEKETGCSAAFCGFSGQLSTIIPVGFKDSLIFTTNNPSLAHLDTFKVETGHFPVMLPLGYTRAFYDLLAQDKFLFVRNGRVSAINRIIKQEHVYAPNFVGDSADILIITKDGFKWAQQTGNCKNF